MEALRDALSTPGELALRRLVAVEQQHAMAGQRGAPYPDPADRDPDVVGELYRQRVRDGLAALRRRREEAVAKVGFVDRLLAAVGIDTAVVRTANVAIEALNAAIETRDFDLDRAWYAGRDEADRRHDARTGWDALYGVMTAKVPVSAVFSTPGTGLGCLTESEVVVLGRLPRVNAKWTVRRGMNEAEERQRQAEATTSRWRPVVASTPTPAVAPEPSGGPRFR